MARPIDLNKINRKVRSFNIDTAVFEELKRQALIESLSMSDLVNRMLQHGLAKVKVKQDVESGLQTQLEIHVQSADIRSKRDDNKCNPKSIDGKCVVCWGDE